MWLIFDKIEFRTDLESKKGKQYSAYVVTGTEKGFQEDPDKPYNKIIFDDAVVTVVQGTKEVEMNLPEFFKLCKEEDLIAVKSEHIGPEKWRWRIARVENKTRKVLDDAALASNTSANGSSGTSVGAVVTTALLSLPEYQEELKDKSMEDVVKYVSDMLATVEETIEQQFAS